MQEAAGEAPSADAHARDSTDVASALGVAIHDGLTGPQAADRLAESGPNALEDVRPPTLPGMLREAITEPFVLLLAAAGVLAVILGEVRDGLLVLIALVPIVGADVVTEFRSERALESLREAVAPHARIRRDGSVLDLPAAELVPGDIVLLKAGDIVPADLRVADADALLIDSSALTGESIPEFAADLREPPGTPVADRRSMAYAGTAVVGGRGLGIVVATGPATEIARIARALAVTERRRSPLQRELDRLVRILLVVAVGLIVLTSGLGFVRGNPIGANVLAGISAAIAAIPEEPPVLLAVVLGLGAFRLLRRGVLVRRLSAEETLGAIDLIITDKTGTLTENRLALREIATPSGIVTDQASRRRLLELAVRAEDDGWHVDAGTAPGSFTTAILAAGDPDDGPLLPDPADLVWCEGPATGRPYSRTRSRLDGAEIGLAIGAPEAILGLSLAAGVDAGAWEALVGDATARGSRMLLLAQAVAGDAFEPLAALGFADPLREDVPEALRLATNAGIQTIVVTGDHPATALAIARAAGIDTDQVVSGGELAAWTDAELAARLPDLTVVARAVPEDKLRLVDVARAAGRTVAVTGDGVNDAPALQHGDVAVAMGSGTAVARDASDLILGDDSFSTLMYALREGRRIVANVQKGLVFIISTHVAMLGFILVATIAGYSQPLLPIQILWMELFIDISASVAFEREAEEPDAMTRPPRRRERPLLPADLLARIGLAGGFSAVAAFVLLVTMPGSPDHVRWLAFSALVVGQVVRAYANRTLTQPITSLRPNGFLAAAVVVVVAIQLLIPIVPPLAEAFRATILAPAEWALIAIIALAPAVVAEAVRRTTSREWVA